MQLRNIQINGFGRLEDIDLELKDGLNLIVGDNESGKSTLTEFVKGIFYGVSRNKNGKDYSDYEKFKPWNDKNFSGKLVYLMESNLNSDDESNQNSKNIDNFNGFNIDKLSDETNHKDNYEKEIKDKGIVIVDFYATWCGPCMMLSPILEELSKEYKVCKINVDEEQELAMEYGIMSIPTLVMFKNGEKVKTSVGFFSKSELEKIIDNI